MIDFQDESSDGGPTVARRQAVSAGKLWPVRTGLGSSVGCPAVWEKF